MVHSARDTLAGFFLDDQLPQIREHMMQRTVAGETVTRADWQAAEAALYQRYLAIFYSPDVEADLAELVGGPDGDDGKLVADMARHASVGVHRLIRDIPVIGDPALRPPTWSS